MKTIADEVLAWANESKGRYIIEDDYDSEFRYYGKPIPLDDGTEFVGNRVQLEKELEICSPMLEIA